MLCEYAYYNKDEKYEKPHCKQGGFICPLIYYCPISERFENSEAMFRCKYRRTGK